MIIFSLGGVRAPLMLKPRADWGLLDIVSWAGAFEKIPYF